MAEIKSPREWGESELEAVRFMVNSPGWKLVLDYMEDRVATNSDALLEMVGEKEGFILIGRIKELKLVQAKIKDAFLRDAKRRAQTKDDNSSK